MRGRDPEHQELKAVWQEISELMLKIIKAKRTRGMSQVAEHLPSKHKELISNFSMIKNIKLKKIIKTNKLYNLDF
jgi:hypothetical protein